jgi:hypothetical protein
LVGAQISVATALNIFRSPPSGYHEAAECLFAILSKEISFDIVSDLLFNLSNALAGEDSIFMADSPPIGPGVSSVCRTPTAILSGCIETIQIFRRLLFEECETKGQIVEILSHILCRFSGGVSLSSEFAVFNDSVLLFGVFAILSNSVDVQRPNSLLRDVRNNAVYYVSSADFVSKEFTVWRLPLTADSVQMTLPFSSDIIPVSAVPFRESMFSKTDLLLPYFLSILRDKPLPAITSSLTFLIVACMREYFTNQGFITTILEGITPHPSTITYADSHWAFVAELRTKFHSSGVSRFPFQTFSPSEIGSLGIVTASTLTSKHTQSFFISDLLPLSGEAALELSADHKVKVLVYLFSPISDDNWFLLHLENPHNRFVWRPEQSSVSSATEILLEGIGTAPVFFLVAVEGGTTRYTLKMSGLLPVSGRLVLVKRAGQKLGVTAPSSKVIQSHNQFAISMPSVKQPTEPLLQFEHDFLQQLSTGLQVSRPSGEVPPPLKIRSSKIPLSERSVVDSDLFQNPFPGIVNYSDSDAPPHIDPFSGTVVSVPWKFGTIAALPTLSLANYTTLPFPLTSLLSQRLAIMRQTEAQNLFFLHCLTTPAIPIPHTLDRFGVDLAGLVHHIQRLLVAIEPLNHPAISAGKCPIDFGRNVLTEASTAACGQIHEVLVAIFAYIDNASLVNKCADSWIANILAMEGHHGYHSCCPENPYAFFRCSSPPGLAIQFRHPKPVIAVRALLNGVQPTNPITFPILTENACGINLVGGGTDIFAFINAETNAALVGTFYEFVISLKYFLLFITQREVLKKAEYRKQIYITVVQALILRSPFFAMFSEQVLHFLGHVLPLESTDLRGELVQILNLLASYCSQSSVINTFLLGLQDLYDEFALIGLKSYFQDFLTEADRAVLSTLEEKRFELPSRKFPFPLGEAIGKEVGRKVLRILAPRESLIGLPFHLFIYEWIHFAKLAPPYESRLDGKVLHVTFTSIVPESIHLTVKQSGEFTPLKEEISVVGNSVGIQLSEGLSWNSIEYMIIGHSAEPEESFLRRYTKVFTDDMSTYLHMMVAALDLEIVREISLTVVRSQAIDISSIKPANFRGYAFRCQIAGEWLV